MAGAAALLAATVLLPGLLASPGVASAQVPSYGSNNYGTFYDVLPPGTNGLDNALALAAFAATGSRPAHNDDQLAMYSNLTRAAPNIQASQITAFFKDASFGVRTGDLAGTESPEPSIERDAPFGVPHIYGDTRAELKFGIGYATGEDRLFLVDALRHAGQGDLAAFAGGSNAPMDASVWASAPYTQQDLENQVAHTPASLPDGRQILCDATNYIDGISAYIANAQLDPLLMPAEYVAIGDPGGPAPFTLEDLVSIASLVGSSLGRGGGDQLANAVLYENLERRFGPEHYVVPGSPQGVEVAPAIVARSSRTRDRRSQHGRGRRSPITRLHRARHGRDRSGFATLRSFIAPNDPEAPTTVRGKSFPYQMLPLPRRTASGTIALPDPGSVQFADHVAAGAVPGGAPPAEGYSKHSTEGRTGVALGAAANAGTRPARVPAQRLERAARIGRPHRLRPPDCRDGATDRVLLARDPHGGGHPRPRDRCRRRGVPGGEPLRRARPRSRLRVVGDLGGAEHHRHLRDAVVRPGRRGAVDRL